MQKLIELSMNITTNKKENKSGEKGGFRMKLEVKTNVKGLEELKELLESAKKQAVELEETLNKISETEIIIEFEPKIYKGENHETSSNDL